jgi:hypothetical protein
MRSTAANFAVVAGSAVLPSGMLENAMPSRPAGSPWNPFLAHNESGRFHGGESHALPVVIGHS